VLEVYAREFKPELNWNLQITRDYLKRKLHKRQETKIIKCLEFIATCYEPKANSEQTQSKLVANSRQTPGKLPANSIKVMKNSGKWDVTINGRYVTIFIPKFIEMLDNWTQRKLRSGDEVAPKKHHTEVEVEVEVEVDKDKNPYGPLFEQFWDAYPKKKSKGNAFKSWKRIKNRPDIESLIISIEANKKTWDWKKEGGQFIPHPASWLNSRGWEDEIDGRQRTNSEDAGALF